MQTTNKKRYYFLIVYDRKKHRMRLFGRSLVSRAHIEQWIRVAEAWGHLRPMLYSRYISPDAVRVERERIGETWRR